jgi:predicted NUDIX family NTP pyrophosphohydrolase
MPMHLIGASCFATAENNQINSLLSFLVPRAARMPNISAGILMYHHTDAGITVLLVHPGGPFWRNRDLGAWSIPKGLIDDGENPEIAARREFAEELGVEVAGPLQSLGQLRQRGGKTVLGFASKGTLNVANVRSNEIPVEWPPRSGRVIYVPEVDRAEWFALPLARKKILASQEPFLDRLERL